MPTDAEVHPCHCRTFYYPGLSCHSWLITPEAQGEPEEGTIEVRIKIQPCATADMGVSQPLPAQCKVPPLHDKLQLVGATRAFSSENYKQE